MNRVTSTYTLRLETAADVAAVQAELDAPLLDRGDLSLSWRATSDTAATLTATHALERAGVTGYAVLTTGLGVHRRTVAVQDPK